MSARWLASRSVTTAVAGPSCRRLPRLIRWAPPDSPSARLASTAPATGTLSDLSLHKHQDSAVRLAYYTFDEPSTSTGSTSATADLDPASPEYARRAKQVADQAGLREAWSQWKATQRHMTESRAMLKSEKDDEMRALAEEELASLQDRSEELLVEVHAGLAAEAATDTSPSGAIIELRSAIGGAESSVFVTEMTRMYERWCSEQGWRVTLLSATSTDTTNASDIYKDAILQVQGDGAFASLQYEAGIHRVQRIPVTTSVAKLQSSTITVVVLPFDDTDTSAPRADDVVNPSDVKSEVMRSRGAGGQHVNKTESAVRLTHLPTGISVSMQDSRSQHQNRERAWQILRARLLDLKMKREEEEARAKRGEQIVGLTRGDRVRTYNFPQDRVTDHRLTQNVGDIAAFMEGSGEGLRTFVEGLQEMKRQREIDERLRALMARREQANK